MVEISELGEGLQKVAIFRCLPGEEEQMIADVAEYVNGTHHNKFVEEHRDTPTIIVTSQVDNFGYKPYTNQTL